MSSLRGDIELKDAVLINMVNLSPEEKKMVRDWRNHENVRIWMFSDRVISMDEHLNFIEGLKHDESNFYWLVKNRKNEYVGVVYLNRVDPVNGDAYIGVYANPVVRMPGAGTLLTDSLKKVAFDVALLRTLKAEVMSDNERAMRLYLKSGFTKDDGPADRIRPGGNRSDVVTMVLTNG